jgi:hypothetical protein
MNSVFMAVEDSTAFAVAATTSNGADKTSGVTSWIDTHQWLLCGLIILACVIICVVTARQVRRDQQQQRSHGRKSNAWLIVDG